MFHHLNRWIQLLITGYPRSVLAAFLILTVVAVLLGSRIEFRDSRSELASPDDPEQARFDRLIDDFHGSTALVAAVEPADGALPGTEPLQSFADELAFRLNALPAVDSVFHRIEIEDMLAGTIWALPPEELETIADQVEQVGPELQSMLASFGPESLVRFFAALIAAGDRTRKPDNAADNAATLVGVLSHLKTVLESPGSTSAADVLLARQEDGYLKTSDGRTLFLFISPSDTRDDLPVQRELVAAVRKAANELAMEQPGFQVGLTGQPALVVEEMAAVSRDTIRTSLVAITGVFLLTLLVFRWKIHAVLVLITLAVGISLALGAVFLELGYLNLITSSFLSTLIGVGIAYGIHPVSEYELMGAHTVPPEESVGKAYRHTGAAVVTAAVTTAAAFFSILLMRFKGFAELGIVAGGGVLLCLLSSMLVLPALLMVYGRWRRRRGVGRTKAQVVAAMDRLWLERGALHVCRYPKTVSVLALGLTAASLWAAFGIRFDTNILKLVPADLESIRYQERMMAESEFSPVFAVVAVDDLGELQRIGRMAGAMDTVSRVDSLLRFLPVNPDRAADSMARLAEMSRQMEVRAVGTVSVQGLSQALDDLATKLADAADDAFGAGLGEIAGRLEQGLEVVEEAGTIVRAATPDRVSEWNEAFQVIAAELETGRQGILAAGTSPPPVPGDLPEPLRQRFMTRSGRLLAFLQPAGDTFDPVWLERYVAECRQVSAEATGFPLVFHHMSTRITSGFYRAVAAGAVVVFLILLVGYRRLGPALLALAPLAMGVTWMLGAMGAMGITFNFANLVAVPLIIGVGIDNGVHVVHRLQYEGEEGISTVLRHTGRAILIASLTTMIGFGSLALASHRGLASLGMVLILGVGACLLTSMVVLPNLLVATGRVRR